MDRAMKAKPKYESVPDDVATVANANEYGQSLLGFALVDIAFASVQAYIDQQVETIRGLPVITLENLLEIETRCIQKASDLGIPEPVPHDNTYKLGLYHRDSRRGLEGAAVIVTAAPRFRFFIIQAASKRILGCLSSLSVGALCPRRWKQAQQPHDCTP